MQIRRWKVTVGNRVIEQKLTQNFHFGVWHSDRTAVTDISMSSFAIKVEKNGPKFKMLKKRLKSKKRLPSQLIYGSHDIEKP